MYTIKIIPQAEKDLGKFPPKTLNKLKTEILNLSRNPRCQGAIKLTQDEGYRIRVGDYRILYRIDDTLKEIFIYRIKHRREVYR